MQTHQIYSIDQNDRRDESKRSYSPYEPEKKNNSIKGSTLILFIIALVLIIALIISIVLVFTIGLKAARRTVSFEENASITSLYEPCKCGCPSIEPLFNDERSSTSRIANGENARKNSWPWQLLLIIVDKNQTPVSLCGATLITDRHILTAAHCVHQSFPPFIFLFSGQHRLNSSLSLRSGHQVNNVYIHEGYNAFYHNDIAILTIQQPLRFDSIIHPICLATPYSSHLQDNEELVAIGWGKISGQPNTTIFPSNLQQVKLAYIPTSHPNCSNLFQQSSPAHPGQMCIGKSNHHVCHGDSGGPLMRRTRIPFTETYYWQQIGIVSATVDCGWNSTWPDVFINIPYYYDWIMTTIKRAI
ncbi:hypothetical protein I4U23_003746 [Adineta vaga]|nr:hypothetical protein I4U23_003746 [Adineta vaga]